HQFADFAGGSGPVFGTKRKKRHDLYADLASAANGPAQGFDAATISFRSRPSAPSRPAATSLHGNRNMARPIHCPRRVILCFGLGHRAGPQTVRISFSFAANMWSISTMPASVAFWISPENRS